MPGTRKVLLATDLTARSDRATDRAILVATQCDADLLALHVVTKLERAPESELSHEERIRDSLAYDLRGAVRTRIEVATGDPAERALEVARAHACDLIITGVARADRLLGPTLGATVDKLVRTSTIPLLVVTERARAPYANIVVAVDFSPASALAAQTAAAWFPAAHLTLFHAFDAPPTLAITDASRVAEQFQGAAHASYAEFVRGLALPTPPLAMLRRGEPEVLINQLATTRAMDLVVLGTHGRGRVAEAILGSVAKRVLAQLACDALIVPSTV